MSRINHGGLLHHEIKKVLRDSIAMLKEEYVQPGSGPDMPMTDRMNRFFSEGRAALKHFTDADADPQQLRRGIEIEMEHTNDPAVSKKIALDHLAELPNYYTLLDAMESHARDKQNDY